MTVNKNKIMIGGIVVFTAVTLYFIYKKIKSMGSSNGKSGSNLPNASKYAKFGNEPLEVARQLEPYAYGSYKWSGTTGMPIDIFLIGDTPTFKKTPDGSTYCTGYTFATFFVTAMNRGLLDDFTNEDIKKIHQIWNQGDSSKKPKLNVDALTKVINTNVKPLGEEVSLEDAQAGDFVQIWRSSGSGHSVIFVDRVIQNGKIVGIKYYSSNAGVNQNTGRSGAGEAIEKFTEYGGKVLKNNTYFARLRK